MIKEKNALIPCLLVNDCIMAIEFLFNNDIFDFALTLENILFKEG